MKKYIALILAVILLASIIEYAYGDLTMKLNIIVPNINGTQSIPYFVNERYFMDRNQPVVCLHESPYTGYDVEIYEKITKGAIKNWTDGLYNMTGGTSQWYLHYVMVPDETPDIVRFTDEFKYCDINIMFDNSTPINITDGSYTKGGTWHYTRANHWADIKVYTWDYFPAVGLYNEERNVIEKQYETKLVPVEVLQQVLEHEFGHAFGLKHHEIDGEIWIDVPYYQPKHAEKSMMYYATRPIYDENKQIRLIDIQALVYKYQLDGWGGKTTKDVSAWVEQ